MRVRESHVRTTKPASVADSLSCELIPTALVETRRTSSWTRVSCHYADSVPKPAAYFPHQCASIGLRNAEQFAARRKSRVPFRICEIISAPREQMHLHGRAGRNAFTKNAHRTASLQPNTQTNGTEVCNSTPKCPLQSTTHQLAAMPWPRTSNEAEATREGFRKLGDVLTSRQRITQGNRT
jgi:hypothetical protein